MDISQTVDILLSRHSFAETFHGQCSQTVSLGCIDSVQVPAIIWYYAADYCRGCRSHWNYLTIMSNPCWPPSTAADWCAYRIFPRYLRALWPIQFDTVTVPSYTPNSYWQWQHVRRPAWKCKHLWECWRKRIMLKAEKTCSKLLTQYQTPVLSLSPTKRNRKSSDGIWFDVRSSTGSLLETDRRELLEPEAIDSIWFCWFHECIRSIHFYFLAVWRRINCSPANKQHSMKSIKSIIEQIKSLTLVCSAFSVTAMYVQLSGLTSLCTKTRYLQPSDILMSWLEV